MAVQNSYGIGATRHQQQISIKICANIVCDCVLGPYVLPPHLTGPYVLPPHLTGPYVLPPHLTGPYVLPPHLTGSYVLPPYLKGPYVLPPHLTSQDLMYFHHNSQDQITQFSWNTTCLHFWMIFPLIIRETMYFIHNGEPLTSALLLASCIIMLLVLVR